MRDQPYIYIQCDCGRAVEITDDQFREMHGKGIDDLPVGQVFRCRNCGRRTTQRTMGWSLAGMRRE